MELKNWQIRKMQELSTEITVGFVGSMTKHYTLPNKGIPFLRSKNIAPYMIKSDDLIHISKDFHKRIKKSRLKPGDIVIVRTGNPGVASLIPNWLEESNCSDLVIVRPNENKVDPRYLVYYLNGMVREHVAEYAVGAVQLHFNVNSVKELPITLPPLPEQKAIASILGSLDDKIELNNKMNETLETMARALYKSWFVDFDPVVAKAAGKKPFGMDDETAALFPDRFVDSELGPIPEGWEIQKLDSDVKLIPGRSYTSKELQESEVALVTLKSFQRGGGYRADGLKPYTGKYSEDQIVKTGDLVVARTDLTQAAEVIGRPALIGDCENYATLVASLDLLVVRPYEPEYLYFFYELLNSSDYLNHVLGYANGTTVLHLHKNALPDYKYPLPSTNLIDLFCKYANYYYSLVLSNNRESQTLSRLRDLLLPKLISGEIRLKDAEKVVEEVL